jgi:hypothetical protein
MMVPAHLPIALTLARSAAITGLALGGLDGVEQVEAAVISALCYLQT